VASEPHVILSGDIVGAYVVKKKSANGELTLVPDTYPTIVPAFSGRPATPEEFQALFGDLPTDGEG